MTRLERYYWQHSQQREGMAQIAGEDAVTVKPSRSQSKAVGGRGTVSKLNVSWGVPMMAWFCAPRIRGGFI